MVAGVAHFNHGLRGADADADEQFSRDLTASLGLSFAAGRGNVAARAREEKRSIEDAARALRAMSFLPRPPERSAADVIAVGHTRDDQAETFLLRSCAARARGASAASGRKLVPSIRPLIEVRRDELRAYTQNEAWRIAKMRRTPTSAFREIACGTSSSRISNASFRRVSWRCSPVKLRPRSEDEDELNAEAIDLAGSIVLTDTPVTVDTAALSRFTLRWRHVCARGTPADGSGAGSSASTISAVPRIRALRREPR